MVVTQEQCRVREYHQGLVTAIHHISLSPPSPTDPVLVVARFRPPNKAEIASGGETIVDFETEDTCQINVRLLGNSICSSYLRHRLDGLHIPRNKNMTDFNSSLEKQPGHSPSTVYSIPDRGRPMYSTFQSGRPLTTSSMVITALFLPTGRQGLANPTP